MAHEIEIRDGKFSYVEYSASGIVTAWHGEGTAVKDALSFDDAMALARLDYPVVKVPTYLSLTDPSMITAQNPTGKYVKKSEMCYAVVRTDTGKELGRVGGDYTPVQNREHFQVIEDLMQRGLLTIETAGVLREGADAWVLGKFDPDKMGPEFQEVVGGEVMPYVLFQANHSGRSENVIAETPIRVVCANTLAMAEHAYANVSTTQRIRHNGKAVERTKEAAETLMTDVVTRYEKLAVNFKMLKNTKLTDGDIVKLVVDVAVTDPRKRPEWNPEGRNADALVERYERKRSEFIRASRDPIGAFHDDSAWDAYNGAVQVIDHNTDLFPTKGGALRSGALMTGVLRKTKENILDTILAHCTGSETPVLDAILSASDN